MRTAIMYSGSQLGNAFGGLFAVAILKLDGKHGLEGWRWVRGPVIPKLQLRSTHTPIYSCS